MIEIAEIVDRKSLQVWLEGQAQDVPLWMVQRAALRQLPFWWEYVLKTNVKKNGDLAVFTVFRKILITCVAHNTSTSSIWHAAEYAKNATDRAFDIDDANAAYASVTADSAVEMANARNDDYFNVEIAADVVTRVTSIVPASDFWELICEDCMAITSGDDLDRLPLWGGQENPLAKTWADLKQQLPNDTSTDWSFWIKWYDDALAGSPPNWKMLERIALIDPADWDKGAERVNPLIAEIVAEYGDNTNAPKEFQPANVSPAAKTEIIERVQQNREVIALSIAGVLEQISEFRERIRGINDLDQAYRENIFAYLDGLSAQLTDLLGQLPDDDQVIEEPQADRLVSWGQQFRHSFTVKAKAYIAPENVAGATLPTGIILGCTAIGSAFGPMGAGAGAVVGKLITGELKPAKAAEALIESDDPSNDE